MDQFKLAQPFQNCLSLARCALEGAYVLARTKCCQEKGIYERGHKLIKLFCNGKKSNCSKMVPLQDEKELK